MIEVAAQDPKARTSDSDRPVGLLHSAHAMDVLDFARVLDTVAGYASTPAGAARVRALAPRAVRSGDADALSWLASEHARVGAMRAFLAREGGWAGHPIPSLDAPLERLKVTGTAWTAPDLRGALVLLSSSRLTRAALDAASRDDAPIVPLAALGAALIVEPALEKDLERVVDEEGNVRDSASPALKRIRKDMRGAEAELIKLLEKLMARLDSRHRVDDASVTVRNGRWVIPVRREGRNEVGGIVHDTSASGATIFVEPPVAVEFANRIRELEAEELREIDRILLEATDALRPRREALLAALEALVVLDALLARARYATEFDCAPATLAAARGGFTIVRGRHPLLLVQKTEDRREMAEGVVPFDLSMGTHERTLLVSGPNTGGKTVLLKAVALLSLMSQAGIPAPVGPGSTIAIFDGVFADIGDEQSIEASLSTFSAHLKNLVEIVDGATADSLVLIDELGSGTDPVEGAALGGALLEELTRRGATTFATTHLGALKELAQEVPGVVNASLQFDAERLAPTYRLIKGIPGRSYGLSIARRLAMPERVLLNAEARVPHAEREVARLLEDLERRQAVLVDREKAAGEHEDAVKARAARIAEREATVRTKEREVEKSSRVEARRYLLDARKEIEKTIGSLKKAGAAALEEEAVSARRVAERLLQSETDALERLDADDGAASRERSDEGEEAKAGELHAGDAVAVGSLGGKVGRVLEVRGDEVVAAVGSMKLTVPLATVRRTSKKGIERVESPPPAFDDAGEAAAKHEVDLRGLRVGELDGALVAALDAAVRADLPSLRIIHGKGTGALRERVAELLKEDRRVREFRRGAWNEGGDGVTVAELA